MIATKSNLFPSSHQYMKLNGGFNHRFHPWVEILSTCEVKPHYMPTFGINIDRCITYNYTRANQVVGGVANKAYCKKDLNI